MGVSSSALLLLGAGAQAFQGFQAYQAGKAQAKAATRTAEYNAAVEQQRANVERMQLQKQQRLFASKARVRAAGSGATLASFGDIEESNTQQSLLDLALLDYDARLRQNQIIYSGQQEAYTAKSQGRSALISGLTSAASTAAGAGGGSGGTGSGYDPAKSAPPRKPSQYASMLGG